MVGISKLMVRLAAPIVTCALLVAFIPVSSGQVQSPELTVAFSTGPGSLEPRIPSGTPAQSILRTIYEPLIYHDRDGKLIPVLATSWRNIGQNILELKLRRNVKFQNGEDFDAQSVKYTIESIISPDSKFVGNRGFLLDIGRVETPDPYTVRFITKVPSRALLSNLTFWPIGILPAKAAAELGPKIAATPIGTGPYKLLEFTPGQQVVVGANPNYWGDKPSYSKITFRIIPENGTRVAALQSGRVMMINNVPPDQMNQLKFNTNFRVIAKPTARIMFLFLRMAKPSIRDLRIRQAMSLAIDRNAIVNNILGRTAQVATGPLPSMVFASAKIGAPEYNPTQAKDLMKQAGYNGEKIEFFVPNGRYLLDKQIGEAIGGYLQSAGFDVNLHVLEFGQIIDELYHGKTWDMMLFGWGIASFDPDYFFSPLLYSKEAPGGYSNPRVDALIEEGKSAIDQKKAISVYKTLQEVVWKDLPFVFLYYQPQIDAVSKRLKGYEPMPDEFIFFDEYVHTKLE